MFGLGIGELFVVLVLILVLFGPNGLAIFAKNVLKLIYEVKHTVSQLEKKWQSIKHSAKKEVADSLPQGLPAQTLLKKPLKQYEKSFIIPSHKEKTDFKTTDLKKTNFEKQTLK